MFVIETRVHESIDGETFTLEFIGEDNELIVATLRKGIIANVFGEETAVAKAQAVLGQVANFDLTKE
ncbi:hypothetical protein LJR231_005431 [Phyllobacterium sp. LjRoot231]|uniref:hypothetical protein n=1 Tax=Phyllobacterium sp. LjRoot231 TaxID=3342289 RepID=UPI003ECEE69E